MHLRQKYGKSSITRLPPAGGAANSRAAPTAASPQTEVAYRTGAEGGNSGAPKFQFFGCSTNCRKTDCLGGFFEESFSRKCSWRPYGTGNRFPGCGGTGSPGNPNRFLFQTVRTPKASLVGELNSMRLTEHCRFYFKPGMQTSTQSG